jgi:L-ascorbate oxidase
MTVIMANARYIQPFEVDNLFIYSSQTYDVLFIANQDVAKNYWATMNIRRQNPKTPTNFVVL